MRPSWTSRRPKWSTSSSNRARTMTSPQPNSPEVLGATQLQFRQGDAKWDTYRQRALSDLYWFAENVLGYGTRIPMRKGPHALLCKFAEKRTGIPALDTAPY